MSDNLCHPCLTPCCSCHRFKTLEDVMGPDHLRFYAGAPLLASDGQRVGAV